jgi:hypothetical protein
MGFAWAQVIADEQSRSADAARLGLLLQYSASRPIVDDFEFGTRFAWGLTDWERAGKWANAGVSVGEWTTRAYKNTYNWTRKRGADGKADPNTHGLRLMGGSMAMCFLWLGYAVAGVSFLIVPLAPTTFLELDFTGNYVLGSSEVKPYFKAGVGFFAFWHPVHNTLVGAVGPTAGTGVRVGEIDIGAVGTWSPPLAHGEAREGDSHIITSAIVVGFVK